MQKGQFFSSLRMTLSRRKSFGRFPRSVEMITQRPVIGSFRNSGKAFVLEQFPLTRAGGRTGDSKLYLFCRLREDVPVSPSHLRAESVFVQPYHWRLPRTVVNGHNVKPAGTFADVTFYEKPLRGANDQVLFFPGNAEFGQCRQVLPDRTRSDFDKCQRLAIVTDQIDFTLDAAGRVIAGHENVPLPP